MNATRTRGLSIALAAVLSILFVCEWLVAQPSSKRSLPALTSQADFDSLAVTYDPDTPYALPHVLFVIDRKDKNRIYYVNTRRYAFHKDFVNGTYLSLERGREFFENNYLKPNRRFIMGTLAYQTPVKRWTFEFWEGDLIPPDQIKLAHDIVNKTFFAPVAFKPNSIRQDEASAQLEGMQRVLQSDIAREQEFRHSCRTSICWQRAPASRTRISRTRRNSSSNTMVGGWHSRPNAIATPSSAPIWIS